MASHLHTSPRYNAVFAGETTQSLTSTESQWFDELLITAAYDPAGHVYTVPVTVTEGFDVAHYQRIIESHGWRVLRAACGPDDTWVLTPLWATRAQQGS